MARRPNPRRQSRRQPAPLMPGKFLLIGLLVVAVGAVWLFPFVTSPSIRYDEFEKLLDQNKLKKVTLVGNDRVYGELREDVRENEELKKLAPSGKFSVKLLPAADREPLYRRL